MKASGCGASHKGNVRSNNEDNMYVNGAYRVDLSSDNTLLRDVGDSGNYSYAVFDGLGGGEQGEVASLMAAKKMSEADRYCLYDRMEVYVHDVHKQIADHARREKFYEMGTTLAAVCISGTTARICNVGDSRIYLWRCGRMWQLSHDHTLGQSLIDSGIVAAGKAFETNRGCELTQYLGIVTDDDMEPEAYIADIKIEESDVLLLCSDGLTGELTEDEICEIISENTDKGIERVAVMLVWNAVQRRCKDNVTAVVVGITN